MLPIAHVGHWIWVLYLPPVLIVAGSITKNKLSERRARRDDASESGSPERETL